MYLDKAREWFTYLRIAFPNQVVPCTTEEMEALEQSVGLKLPEAYEEFLLWMGHGAGDFLIGSDCFYSILPDIQEWAVELLKENDFPQRLPDDAFVFWMHQGYQFAFFRTSEGDDPPVHYYNEALHKEAFAVNHPGKFSDFLVVEMKAHAEHDLQISRLRAEAARDWRRV